MDFDLYAWKAPRDLDAAAAAALVGDWEAAGGDPAASPFEASTDVGWFLRELRSDLPGLETLSDGVPTLTRTPIVLAAHDEPPARVVAIRLPRGPLPEVGESIGGLAAKYDLVVFDARRGRIHVPLEELAAYATATFWPAGAIQAAAAGSVGALIAAGAWVASIPLLSGLLVLAGGFMAVLAVLTFVAEGRRAIRGRGRRPPDAGRG